MTLLSLIFTSTGTGTIVVLRKLLADIRARGDRAQRSPPPLLIVEGERPLPGQRLRQLVRKAGELEIGHVRDFSLRRYMPVVIGAGCDCLNRLVDPRELGAS